MSNENQGFNIPPLHADFDFEPEPTEINNEELRSDTADSEKDIPEDEFEYEPEVADILMGEGYEYKSPFSDVEDVSKVDLNALLIAPTVDISVEDASKVMQRLVADEKLTASEKVTIGGLFRSYVSGLYSGRYDEILGDDKNLAQYLEVDGKKIGGVALKSKLAPGTERLTGVAARRRVSAMLGTGNNVYWRLGHSGIVVNIGNFSPGEIFEFQTKLIHAVEEIGMKTRGQILSTDDVHIIVKEVDFVLDHVIDTSIHNWTLDILRDNLDVRDLLTLLTAGLASMYPEGYPFLRSCEFKGFGEEGCDWDTFKGLQDPSKIVKLDFTLITHLDVDAFTKKQIRILNSPMQGIKVDRLAEYRDEFKQNTVTTPPVNETGGATYKLVIKAPMYSRYRREGLLFTAEVIHNVDNALSEAPDLGLETSTNRRKTLLGTYLTRINAQRHGSWIESIIEDSPEGQIIYGGSESQEDRLNIMERLADFSANETVCNNTIEYVEDFKKKQLHSFIGIPDYKCPSCKRNQTNWTNYRAGIIPISISQYFFDIMALSQGRKL